jgi:hypothetical protein
MACAVIAMIGICPWVDFSCSQILFVAKMPSYLNVHQHQAEGLLEQINGLLAIIGDYESVAGGRDSPS